MIFNRNFRSRVLIWDFNIFLFFAVNTYKYQLVMCLTRKFIISIYSPLSCADVNVTMSHLMLYPIPTKIKGSNVKIAIEFFAIRGKIKYGSSLINDKVTKIKWHIMVCTYGNDVGTILFNEACGNYQRCNIIQQIVYIFGTSVLQF